MLSSEVKKASHLLRFLPCVLFFICAACSFDYGNTGGSDDERPDIVMENIEYVRVRGGDPLVRFRAEYAERWEDRQTMNISDFSFEQLGDHGETVNAEGGAGTAKVSLESGDVSLSGGVRINIESENITIKTEELEWKDKDKVLEAGSENEVAIERSDGTLFTGRGFSADARNRTWAFSAGVQGRYVEEDGDEEGEGERAEESAGAGEGGASMERPEREPVQVLPPRRISN